MKTPLQEIFDHPEGDEDRLRNLRSLAGPHRPGTRREDDPVAAG